MGGVLLGLLVQVGFAPFLSSTGGNRKEREREREGGAVPSSLSYSDSQGGARAATSRGLPSLSLRPMLAQHFPGGFR